MVKIKSLSKKGSKYLINTGDVEHKVTEETMIRFSITKGKEFTEEEFKSILSFSKQSNYINMALRYLSFKDRSIYQMREYLNKKEVSNADKLIKMLLDKGYLNDSRFAQNMFEHMFSSRKGPFKLRSELFKARVDDDITSHVLSQYTFEMQVEVLLELIEKELSKRVRDSYKSYLNKLKKRFVSYGFSLDAISMAIDESKDDLGNLVNEEESLLRDYEKIKFQSKHRIIQKLMQKGYKYSEILKLFDD